MGVCTSPLTAYRLDNGSISFAAKSGQGDALSIPCGQCMDCRLERSRQWAVRCVHESKMHEHNCFVTLTYSDEHMPENGNLHYPHFQRFMRNLRKRFPDANIRFYACGEYGDTFGRAHYHACLFGVNFLDRKPYRKSKAGFMAYESPTLQSLWKYGNAWVGDFTFETAGYTSRYITKKLLGNAAKYPPLYVNQETGETFHRVPEFTRMSLKPGIGRPFYEKYHTDIFPHDRIVIRGSVSKPPRYYSRLYAKSNPSEWEEISYRRYLSCKPEEQEFERLEARAKCTQARLTQLKRGN